MHMLCLAVKVAAKILDFRFTILDLQRMIPKMSDNDPLHEFSGLLDIDLKIGKDQIEDLVFTWRITVLQVVAI